MKTTTPILQNNSQQEKAKYFDELHHAGKLLLLPNIWDSLGAQLLEDLGYPAVATASAAVAFSNGYDDGERIPIQRVLALLSEIVAKVHVPVSADIESGFSDNENELASNIKQLLETGIVGINLEDTDKKTNSLLTADVQCERIRIVKQIARETAIPLFVNARTDVYLRGPNFKTSESRLEEALRRGMAYKSAGADCFYPIGMTDGNQIKKTVEELQMPVNVLTIPGIPELKTLHEMGVARVSLGPSFLKVAIRAMKELALKLQKFEGLSEITENEVTSAYLKDLVNRKPASPEN